MRIHEIITEGRDAPLYHLTTLEALDAIINANALRPQGRNGSTEFISLTRNPRLSHITGRGRGEVVLVVDQRRLAQKYRMEPTDDNPDNKTEMPDSAREDEEVVWGTIEPLHRYLVSVRLLVSFRSVVDDLDDFNDSVLYPLLNYTTSHGIVVVDKRGEFLNDFHEELVLRERQ